MDTLRDVLARERRSDRPALSVPGDPHRRYDYRRFLTDAWKTGNFLSHCGVRRGRTVGIVGTTPEALLGFLGTALLGGIVRFDPPPTVTCRALVAPIDRVADYDLPPGGQRIACGGESDDPGVAYFERDVWSQNPVTPPANVEATDAVLATEEQSVTHVELLDAAEPYSAEFEVGDEVALRAPLTHPGTVAAGVVAPLLAGATILLPDDEAVGDVAVAETTAPEARTIDPSVPY